MKCKITKSIIKPFMSFGKMPLANGFLSEKNIGEHTGTSCNRIRTPATRPLLPQIDVTATTCTEHTTHTKGPKSWARRKRYGYHP